MPTLLCSRWLEGLTWGPSRCPASHVPALSQIADTCWLPACQLTARVPVPVPVPRCLHAHLACSMLQAAAEDAGEQVYAILQGAAAALPAGHPGPGPFPQFIGACCCAAGACPQPRLQLLPWPAYYRVALAARPAGDSAPPMHPTCCPQLPARPPACPRTSPAAPPLQTALCPPLCLASHGAWWMLRLVLGRPWIRTLLWQGQPQWAGAPCSCSMTRCRP